MVRSRGARRTANRGVSTMAVRPLGLAPGDDWTADPDLAANGGQPWSDTDLSGTYGPGGFQNNPRLTGPAVGPARGMTLGNSGGAAPLEGDVMPPANSPIPNNKMISPRWTPEAQDAIIKGGGAPTWMPGRGWVPAAIAAGGAALTGLNNWMHSGLTPSSAAGGGDTGGAFDYPRPPPAAQAPVVRPPAPAVAAPQPGNQIGVPGAGPGPTIQPPWQQPPAPTPPPGPLAATPFTQPQHPNSAAPPLPFESGFPLGGGDPRGPDLTGPGNPNRPGAIVPPPIGSPAPAMPPRRPSPVRTPAAAGPAAVRQQPNLGRYIGGADFQRPNFPAGGNARGGGGGPSGTALDLSRFFQRNQQ